MKQIFYIRIRQRDEIITRLCGEDLDLPDNLIHQMKISLHSWKGG